MSSVKYTKLEDMTESDAAGWIAYDEVEEPNDFPDRVLAALADMNNSLELLPIGRLDHSLQSATRAFRDGRSEEYCVAALIHDLGDSLAPFSAGEYAAAILRPFVDERICWIVEHHEIFTLHYYGEFFGADRDARDRYLGHPYYADAVDFSAMYDQNCFDPDYETLSLEFFRPMTRRVLGELRNAPEGREYMLGSNRPNRP